MATMQPDDHKVQDLLVKVATLEDALRQSQKQNAALAEDLKQAKQNSLELQIQVEAEEEFLTNNLMKKLEKLKTDKDKLALQVEQEEEMLTNTLQKKLDKLKQEKIDLENQLEQEQEYVVNRLHKQLEDVTAEKHRLESKLGDESAHVVAMLKHTLKRLCPDDTTVQTAGNGRSGRRHSLESEETKSLIERMRCEIASVKQSEKELRDECDKKKESIDQLLAENRQLKNDKFTLSQKVTYEKAKFTNVSRENIHLQDEIEREMERQFNTGQSPPLRGIWPSSGTNSPSPGAICISPSLKPLATTSPRLMKSSSSPAPGYELQVPFDLSGKMESPGA